MRDCIRPKVDNIVLIKQYRVGHGFHKSQHWYQSQVDEKSARRPKYLLSRNMIHQVRIGRYVAENKSEDLESQLWDTR